VRLKALVKKVQFKFRGESASEDTPLKRNGRSSTLTGDSESNSRGEQADGAPGDIENAKAKCEKVKLSLEAFVHGFPRVFNWIRRYDASSVAVGDLRQAI